MEVRECLLSFGAESSVFQYAIQKYKDKDIQNDKFAYFFISVWNVVSHTEGKT